MNDTEKIYQNITGKRAFHYGSPTFAYIKWLNQPLKSKLEKPEEELSYCENCGLKRDNTTDLVCIVCGNEFEKTELDALNQTIDNFLKIGKEETKPIFENDYSLYQTKIDTLEEQLSEQKEELSEYREEEEKRDTRNANLLISGIFIFFIAAIVFAIIGIYELYLSLSPLIIEDIMLSCIIIGAIASMICLVSYSVKDF